MGEETEIGRQLTEIAWGVSKAFKSQETPFLHAYYGKKDPPYQSVPFYENLLYSLILLRKRTVEFVHEGEALLDKLLAYQSDSGLFPVYLHDFPEAYDKGIGAFLLPVFLQIEKKFGNLLGVARHERLKKATSALINATLPQLEKLPLYLRLRAAGAIAGWGETAACSYLAAGDLQALGHSPSKMADAALGLLLGRSSQFQEIYSMMQTLWHPQLECYVGPYGEMPFILGKPGRGLFEGLMAEWTQKLPSGLHGTSLPLLELVLAQPLLKPLTPHPIQANLYKQETMAISWQEGIVNEKNRSSYPFALTWGSKEMPHVFALRSEWKFSWKISTEGTDAVLIIHDVDPASPPPDDRGERIILEGFFTSEQAPRFSVNGLRTTTFRAGDELKIEADKKTFILSMEASGGTFQGHLSKAWSPSEIGRVKDLEAPWKLLVRQVGEERGFSLKVRLTQSV